MSGRHRFPGNGYRSNAISSRVSTESSLQNYLDDSHGNSRPFGRVNPTPSSPVPYQNSRRGDIFVEAGRLAVDYLVSRGLLAPEVLSTSSFSETLKINNDLDFNRRPREVAEDHNSPTMDKSTTLACSDDPSDKKERSPLHVQEKQKLLGSFDNSAKCDEIRRDGSLPDKSFDNSAKCDEIRRDGSLPDKPTPANMVADCSSVHIQLDAKSVDTNPENSTNDMGDSMANQDEKCLDYEKNTGASQLGDIAQDTDQLSSLQVGMGKESMGSGLGEEDASKKSSIQYCGKDAGTSSKDPNNLLTLCSSPEFPVTSSSKHKSADTNVPMSNSSDNNCQPGIVGQLAAPVQRNSAGASSGSPDHEICGSSDQGKGIKRSLGNGDAREDAKKAKDWLTVSQNAADLKLSDKSKPAGDPEMMPSPGGAAIQDVNQGGVMSTSMLARIGVGPSVAYAEEKQLFPGSFKICDLNLMDVCDNNEIHGDPTAGHSSHPVPGRGSSIGIDLSMNNSCGLSSVCNKYDAPNEGVEIIDLESDPLQGEQAFHNSDRRMEPDFTGLESFPGHMQSASENTDVQDGFGFMLSPLVGTDIQNIPSGQPALNALQNEIGVHHGEGILCDDDQIYMSLGEIPISLLRPWDQPPQDYDKSF